MTRRDRSRLAVLRWGVILIVLSGLAVALWERRHDLQGFREIDSVTIGFASVATLVSYILNGVAMRACLKALGTQVSLAEATRLQVVGYSLNLLPLKGGTVLIGAEMRRRYDVSWGKYAALTAGSQLVSLATFSVIAGVCLLVSSANGALGLLLTGGPLLLGAATWHWGRSPAKDRTTVAAGGPRALTRRLRSGLYILARDRPTVLLLVLVNTAIVGVHGARLWALFGALGTPVSMFVALAAISLGSVAYLVSIVPGGIGFRESGIVAGCVSMGVSASSGFAAAIADRAIDLLWIVVLGLPLALTMARPARRGQQ